MIDTRHAVLTDSHIITIDTATRKLQSRQLQRQPRNAVDLWALGQQVGLTHLWIMPETKLDGAETVAPREGYSIFATTDDEGPKFARVWKDKASGHRVYIGFPHRWYGWSVSTPLDVLATVDYLGTSLGITVQWSAGHMAFSLVKKVHSTDKRQSWVRESAFDLRTIPFQKSARDVVFKTVLDSSAIGKYLVHYDKNSAYLSACRGVNNGCGEPVHLTDLDNIDISLPGIYRVNVTANTSIFDGKLLPEIINTPWVTSDVLVLAKKKGYEVEVVEGFQFEEKHRILDAWAEKLWSVRSSFKLDPLSYPYEAARQNAYSTIKQIACIGVGRFAMKKYDHDFMRPNWWAEAVGKARVTLCLNLEKLHEQGHDPVLIYNDGVFFVSDSPDPASIPGLLAREGQLGGYKHEYSLEITEDIVGAFQSLSAAKLLGLLNDIADYNDENGGEE